MPRPGLWGFVARQTRARPLAVFSLVFLAGIALRGRFSMPLYFPLCAGLAALALGIALRAHRVRGAAVCAAVAVLCAGALRMGVTLAAIPRIETRYSVDLVGEVVSEPFTNDNGRVVSQFRVETVNGDAAPMKLRLYLRGDEEAMSGIDCGQRLAVRGHIWACDPVTNPYEFDFGAFLRRDGMAGYATAKIEDVRVLEARSTPRTLIIALRRALARRVDALFPRNAGMVRALLLGDRSLLGEEMRDALRATGTAHLIAISGLHVSVLAAAVAALLGRFAPRRIANAAALTLLLLYGALIGFGAPFARATAMFAVFHLAREPGLPTEAVNRLGAAMLLLLLIRPMAARDGAFALSFGAVAGIVLLAGPLTSLLRLDRGVRGAPGDGPLSRLRRYFCGLLVMSLAAQLAILPVVIASFGTQSVVSLPCNLVCVPLCMAGYVAALISLALSGLWLPLGAVAAWIAEGLLSALSAVTRWCAALPVTALRIGRYPWWLCAAHCALIVAASGLSRAPLRRRRWFALALLGVAGLSSLTAVVRAWPFGVVFLDAEQADCAVLRTEGRTYLFDAGDTYTPAADYLSATCLHLNGVFLSHPHQDHAGGLTEVLELFTPDAIYVPKGWFDQRIESRAVLEGIERAREMGVPIVELAAGDEVPLSRGAALTVFSPDPERPPESVNDLSLLARAACGGTSVLFTGDLTVSGEPDPAPDTDVLKVAHHGAMDATSAAFLAQATPEIAVISVGENRFGHPAGETLARLEDAGARVYKTLDSGAIEMTYLGGAWRVKSYLGGGP